MHRHAGGRHHDIHAGLRGQRWWRDYAERESAPDMRIWLFLLLSACVGFGENAVLLESATQTLLQTNVFKSNILAGAGITISKGAKGVLTIASTGGGGGGTNFNGIFVTNSIFGTNYIYAVTTNNVASGIVSREILTNALDPIVALVATNALWTNENSIIYPLATTNHVSVGPVILYNIRSLFEVYNPNLNNSLSVFYDEGGTYGSRSIALIPPDAGSPTNAESAGLLGLSIGAGFINYGLVGQATPALFDGRTNVGVAGVAIPYGSSGIYVGGFFAVAADDSQRPLYENAALLVDTLNQGGPLIVARTNNGTTVFKMDGVGDLTKLKSIDYSWPSSQGAAASVLTNDGGGILGWGVLLFQPASWILSNVVANTFTTNLNTNFNTVDGSFTDISNTNEVMANFESAATNTFLL